MGTAYLSNHPCPSLSKEGSFPYYFFYLPLSRQLDIWVYKKCFFNSYVFFNSYIFNCSPQSRRKHMQTPSLDKEGQGWFESNCTAFMRKNY